MIYEISKINGIVGIAFGDIFLSKLSLKEIAKYLSKLIEKFPYNLSIGSDFYGVSREHQIRNLNNPKHLKNLYNALLEYLPNQMIENFFYKNAYEFFKKIFV
jgi:hypothetical protein